MSVDPVRQFVDFLCAQLLSAPQADTLRTVLTPGFSDPRLLAEEVFRRHWLPPFRITQLDGNGVELSLGDYILLSRLGEGGMGLVFRVRNRGLDRVEALKYLHPRYHARPDAVTRFERERHEAAQLTHANVVGVHHAGSHGTWPFYTMDLAEGLDLRRLLLSRKGQPLPTVEACDYLSQAAEGLAYLHGRGLIHRDVTPANLMVTGASDGTLGRVVKLLDLGLVREFQPKPNGGGLTRPDRPLGTPDYLAPEQESDARGVGFEADIYSLGCCLVFALTGQTLTPAVKADGLALDSLPASLRPLVRSMLSRDPKQRPTARAVADALKPPGLSSKSATAPAEPTPSPDEVRCFRVPQTEAFARAVVPSVAFTESGVAAAALLRSAVSSMQELRAILWEQETGAVLHALHPCSRILHDVAVFPDGRRLLYAEKTASDRLFTLLDLADPGQPCLTWKGPAEPLTGLALAPDGEHFLVTREQPPGADDRENVLLYSVKGWNEARAFGASRATRRAEHRVGGLRACFSGDSRRVLCASKDLFSFWDVVSGRRLSAFPVSLGRPLCLAWSADGRWAFTCNMLNERRLWDVERRQSLRALRMTTAPVQCAVFSPDGHRLLTAEGQTLRLWDVESGAELQTFSGHRGLVHCVTFAADGRLALSGSDDRTVRLWQIR